MRYLHIFNTIGNGLSLAIYLLMASIVFALMPLYAVALWLRHGDRWQEYLPSGD